MPGPELVRRRPRRVNRSGEKDMEKNQHGLKPTCREVHRLVSEGMDRDLSLVERARMRLHLMVCQACTRFTGQMNLLRRAMRQMPPLDEPAGSGDPAEPLKPRP